LKFLNSSKKEPEKVGKIGKGIVPIEKIRAMSEKGFSEPEIIDVLRKEGYSSEEIDSGLTQALKLGVTGQMEGSVSKLPTLQELQSQQIDQGFNEFAPQPQQSFQDIQIPEQSMSIQDTYYGSDYNPEELVESIIHERMGELDSKLSEFRSKYTELERKMANLHNQLTIISKSKSESEHLIISKLDSLSEIISEMNGRISSLEKAFREALPALIESVRSLTDLVGRIKREG